VVRALVSAHRRFATGTFLLWYPVIERGRVEALLQALVATGMRGLFRLELCPFRDLPGRGMTGSGLVIVNPPWTLAAAGETGLARLAARLGTEGPLACHWLVPPP
jgi:23S rRNA (adenine2030-N6)-methyltransferase